MQGVDGGDAAEVEEVLAQAVRAGQEDAPASPGPLDRREVAALAGDPALDWGFTLDDVTARTERYRRCVEAAGRALRGAG